MTKTFQEHLSWELKSTSTQLAVKILQVVQELRDKKGGDCADSPTSMKFGTNVAYGVEIQIFEGAEAGALLGGHGGKSKMAAARYLNFIITS